MDELSVVPIIDAPAGALPPSAHPVNEPEVSNVPDTSGNDQVRAAVRSKEVIVPVNELVFMVDCGSIAILSEFAVVDENTAEPVVPRLVVVFVAGAVFKVIPPVPDVMVAEVAPVALPRVIALAAASVPKFNAPVPV